MTRDLLSRGPSAGPEEKPGDISFRLDVDGRIVFWSEEARRLLGYSAAQIVGRSYGRLFPTAEAARLIPARELAAAEVEGCAGFDGWRVRQDGQQVRASGVITAERGSAGEVVGFSVAVEGPQRS